jgi:hypothetical protein
MGEGAVDLFAAKPDSGMIGFNTLVLDRPHLAHVRAVLRLASDHKQ